MTMWAAKMYGANDVRAVVALPTALAGEPRRRVEAGPGKHSYTIPIG